MRKKQKTRCIPGTASVSSFSELETPRQQGFVNQNMLLHLYLQNSMCTATSRSDCRRLSSPLLTVSHSCKLHTSDTHTLHALFKIHRPYDFGRNFQRAIWHRACRQLPSRQRYVPLSDVRPSRNLSIPTYSQH